MKAYLITGFFTFFAVMLSQASTITLNGRTYAVTSGSYASNADWESAVDAEFGADAEVADFATLKLDALADPNALWDFLVQQNVTAANLEYNGLQLFPGSSEWSYFLQVQVNDPGAGWFVIDFIDVPPTGYPDRINLGRWSGTRQILAVVPTAVPEPSTAMIALPTLLAFLRRRR